MTLATAGVLAQTTDPSFEGHRMDDWDTGEQWRYVVDITPDGRYLLGTVKLTAADSAVSVWDAMTQTATTYPIPGYSCHLANRGGLSADGRRIAGTCRGSDGYFKAAFIQNGALQILTGLPGETHQDAFWSEANDISADGTTVIGSVYIQQGATVDYHPFQWTAGGGMVDLGAVEGSRTNKALRVSDDGSTVVGWFQGSVGRVPAVWRGPSTGARVLAAGITGEATAVNHDGTCIGGYATNYGIWLWKAGQAQLVGGVPNTPSVAVAAISDDCNTVFMTAANPYGAWVWTQGIGIRSFASYVVSRGVQQTAIDGWSFKHSSAMTPDAQVFAGSGFDLNDLPPAFIDDTHAYVVRFEPPSMPCELDWNCDGVVDVEDWQDRDYTDGTYGGFYLDVNLYGQYHATYPDLVDGGYYRKNYALCNGAPGNLDWDGNGVINLQDAYKGAAAASTLNSFYTQIYVYLRYPGAYSNYYPNSACTP
jgi:hypothetical protein